MFEKIIEILNNSHNVAIYTHINTDCDAIGSSLALREVLIANNKNVDIFVNSEFPSNFKFFDDLDCINKKNCDKYDTCVCLDCASLSRLGRFRYIYRKGVKNSIAIDHHVGANENFCKINFVRTASSTAEILFSLFSEMKQNISQKVAKYLIAGIITDTGRFTHSADTNTFVVVSKLLKFGNFRIEDVANPILNSMPMSVFNLTQMAYKKVEFFCENKLAVIILKYSDYLQTGAKLDDIDGVPDMPLMINDVKFAIVASEDDKGYYRVSFRSKGEISARSVAESFGGGGHLNASGCKLFGEYDEVKQKLIDTTASILGWSKND